jgi:purine-nucleoside phosphorylase
MRPSVRHRRRAYARAVVAHHLRPKAPYAPDVLLPGDPGRALTLAQQLLTEPKMSNHHRGLWGYSGETGSGRPLSIQATGVGGPSAAIVLEELAGLGVQRAIRVGTCGALDSALALGDLISAEGALAEDGVSRALGVNRVARPDLRLQERLTANGATDALIASTDLFYEVDPGTREGWLAAGARAVEMEAAALFALGARLGVAVGCALVVSDVFPGGKRRRISDQELAGAVERMGTCAARTLAGSD